MFERENNMYIRQFINFLVVEKGNAKSTAENYERDLKMFFFQLNKSIHDITNDDIYIYIEKLNEELKRNSVLRKIASIRTFFRFCYMNKIISNDPTVMIKNLKREHRLPDVLSLDEIKKIIDACDPTYEGKRDQLIIKLLVATGARISEVLNLEIQDVENQDYEFIKVLGKGSKYRIIPIYDRLELEIKNYLTLVRPQIKNSNSNYKLFPSITRENFWRRLKKITKKLEISKNVYPHIFRHSVATALLSNGADIRIVQEILGHVNITTTEIYTHVDKKELKKIYDRVKIGDD